MKYILRTVLFFTLMFSSDLYGQKLCDCDTVYEHITNGPQFNKDIRGLLDYFNNDLAPIINKCVNQDMEIISKLYIIITVNKNGKIVNATFPKCNFSDNCKNDMKNKLLTMSGWKPGQIDGKKVCSLFYWPININWNL